MANKLFTRPAPAKDPEPTQSEVYLINEETRTFGFSVKASEGHTGSLTQADRIELHAQGLNNMSLAKKAKALWAEGEKPGKIADKCRVSLSYAKKMSMCFGRAASGSKFKEQHSKSMR